MGLLTNYIKELQYEEIAKYDTPTKKSRVENEVGDSSSEATQDREAGLFHPKQQVLEQITPEALIVSLKRGNPYPIVLIDEFKTTGDVLRTNSNLKSVYCKAYTEGSFVYSTMTRGTVDVQESALSLLVSFKMQCIADQDLCKNYFNAGSLPAGRSDGPPEDRQGSPGLLPQMSLLGWVQTGLIVERPTDGC